jgi:hypothetical protein
MEEKREIETRKNSLVSLIPLRREFEWISPI